jgi:hypothetical protein
MPTSGFRDTRPLRIFKRKFAASSKKSETCSALNLSWRRDLNPRPSDYKSDALPTELRQPTQTSENYHIGVGIASTRVSKSKKLHLPLLLGGHILSGRHKSRIRKCHILLHIRKMHQQRHRTRLPVNRWQHHTIENLVILQKQFHLILPIR